jgi:uncharacterized RDD family membrane protein YckC
MPIKVRCKECSTVLTVSDKAAGRAIKCKECGAPVRVPSGKPAKQRPRKRPRPDAPPADPDNLFGGIDLGRAADTKRRVCPNCTAAVGQDDIECPKCGVNIETGILSERERKRRKRKGPPPEEFYGAIWGNSWKFLKGHWGYAIRSGMVWGLTATLAICSAFTLNWYLDGRELALRESAEGQIEVRDDAVIITPGKDGEAKYDGKRYTAGTITGDTLILPGPRMGAWMSPPTYFWVGMLCVFCLGFGGWAWTMTIKIVDITMSGEKKIKRFQTDLFASMALGCRTVFWPLILFAPVLWIPPLVGTLSGSPVAAGIIWLCIFVIPLLVFLPAALTHMTQRYTYRAWLIYWMGKDLFKTFMPSMYVGGLLFFLVLIIPGTMMGFAAANWNQVSNFYLTSVEQPALGSMFGYDPANALNFFEFTFYRFPFLFCVSFLSCFLLCGILAFPAVFMMRVYGLYGLYFRPDLSLINEQVELTPAGFGPRFLAYLIDLILMNVLSAGSVIAAIAMRWLVTNLYSSETVGIITYFFAYFGSLMTAWCTYFASWESGQNRATLGKAALGIIVLTDDDQPITMKQGVGRFASACVTVLTFYIGFIVCAFRSDHKAIHDIMSKTKVVWRGEENQ